MRWIYILATLACIWFLLPFVVKKIQIGRLRRVCKAGRLIALTYDDGPSTQLINDLLEILREWNAFATFFLLGHKVNGSRAVVARIITAGHEVGSHSYRHLHAWKCNPISAYRDIQHGLRAIRSFTECRLFRAPYGKVTLGTLFQVSFLGCVQSWWTVDSTDTWKTHRQRDEILDQVRKQGGGIVLMHDLDRPGSPERNDFVLSVTRGLLEMAEAEGFRICTLGEVLRISERKLTV